MRFQLSLCAMSLLVASTVSASAFSTSFKWCGGPSPVFSLSGVPNGTKTLQFHMIDLDKPDYNHGGGNVAYTGQKTIACGALNNYSPPSCVYRKSKSERIDDEVRPVWRANL
jgi:hypothetical protein